MCASSSQPRKLLDSSFSFPLFKNWSFTNTKQRGLIHCVQFEKSFSLGGVGLDHFRFHSLGTTTGKQYDTPVFMLGFTFQYCVVVKLTWVQTTVKKKLSVLRDHFSFSHMLITRAWLTSVAPQEVMFSLCENGFVWHKAGKARSHLKGPDAKPEVLLDWGSWASCLVPGLMHLPDPPEATMQSNSQQGVKD